MKQTIFQNSWNTASTAPRDIYNLTNYFLVLKSLTQETHNTSNSENQHEFFFRKNLIVAKVWKWKSLSRVWLCDPMDYTVHGILQTKILEWVAFPFSRGCSQHQGLNPGLLHCRRILYQLSHKGSPGILEWVTHPFSRGSSRPRNRTGVSCIAGWFFTNWAIREANVYRMLIMCQVLI